MFTDTHSHIHFQKEFPDIEKILERSRKAGVISQVIVGCTPRDSFQALEFVKKYSDFHFYSTLGVHPHNANELNDEILARFENLVLKEPKIVALGEMGLDYFRNFQPHDLQQKTFRRQLALAKKLDLAVVVHVRDAWEDALKILQEEGNTKVILHCFTGSMEIADKCIGKGYFLSFSGVLTYPKNEYLREIATIAPKDKILIETDCPYLTPNPYRGQRNEPAFVVETAKVLAKIRQVSLDEMAEITTKNAREVFGIESK